MPLFKNDLGAILTISTMIIGLLLLDLATPYLMDEFNRSMFLVMCLVGCCIGQINLITVWAALAPGHVIVRVPWAITLAVFMWFAILAGNHLAFNDLNMTDALFLGVSLMIGVVACQIPLWVARLAFGWRLLYGQSSVAEARERADQYSIRHLLIGMVVLSLALAPIRLVLPEDTELVNSGPPIGEFIVMILTALFCNLAIAVPVVWGAFLNPEKMVVMAIVWLFYCLILTVIEYVIFTIALGPPPDDEIPFALYALNAVQCLTVLFGLMALRGAGFRLVKEGAKPDIEVTSPIPPVASKPADADAQMTDRDDAHST